MKEVGNFIKADQDIQTNVNKIKQEIINDIKFMKELSKLGITLTEDKLNNSLVDLLQYKDLATYCNTCKGIEFCKQSNTGFKPLLKDDGAFVHIQYKSCEYRKAYETKLAMEANLKSFFMPKKVLHASMDQLDLNENRQEAILKVATFAKSYTKEKFMKGVYLYGPFGVGKTFVLSAMANALVKRGIKVAFVYLPDMIRELKSAIGNNNLENMLFEIKTVDVLILDDIGSEMNTQWVRDEIIGPLLQFRMLEELPTFFSSNKSVNELINDYSTTTDHVKDETKALRIGDRIKALSDEYFLNGQNYRY